MGNLENNWSQKTLTNLEKDEWLSFGNDSRLIRRSKELRNIPLSEFTTEDLRLMIGQKVGLEYLVPLAIEMLKENLFAEGDLFEGDLLKSMLSIQPEFWEKNKEYQYAFNNVITDRREEIEERNFDLRTFYSSQS